MGYKISAGPTNIYSCKTEQLQRKRDRVMLYPFALQRTHPGANIDVRFCWPNSKCFHLLAELVILPNSTIQVKITTIIARAIFINKIKNALDEENIPPSKVL